MSHLVLVSEVESSLYRFITSETPSDKIPVIDIGTYQLKDSSPDLYVAPLPLVDILEYSSLDAKTPRTSRSACDPPSLDERTLVERRARSVAKSWRRQMRQQLKENSFMNSVEKGISHVCSAGGRGELPLRRSEFPQGAHFTVKDTTELDQFQAAYDILRRPTAMGRRQRSTEQPLVSFLRLASPVTNMCRACRSICVVKDYTMQKHGELDLIFGPVSVMREGVAYTRSRTVAV